MFAPGERTLSTWIFGSDEGSACHQRASVTSHLSWIHSFHVLERCQRFRICSKANVTGSTSMPAPHVAGFVFYLHRLEGLSTPDAVKARLEELALKDVVQDAQSSPNRLLYTGAA